MGGNVGLAIARDAARDLSDDSQLQPIGEMSDEVREKLIGSLSLLEPVEEGSASPKMRLSKDHLHKFVEAEAESNSERIRRLVEASKAIGAKYEKAGGAFGELGVSTSKVVELADGSYREDFRGGHIMSHNGGVDVTAMKERGITVRYRGLKCFGETSGAGSDEPYVLVSMYQPEPWAQLKRGNAEVMRFPASGTYEDVEDGDTRTAGIDDLAVTAPQDLVVSVVVMEHDDGDPEKVRKAVKEAIQKGADAGMAAASGGTATSAPLDSDTLQGMAVNWFADAVVSVLGSGDDLIGSTSFVITRDEQEHLPPMKTEGDITYNYAASKGPITDGDASYGVYFEVFATEFTPPHRVE